MYRAVTRAIQVTVTPSYLDEQSSPDKKRFFWAYTVEIVNLGSETVRLRSRYWHIRDGEGRIQEVRGDGVIGKQPRTRSWRALRIYERLPARDTAGHHGGSYQMETAGGAEFSVEIPAFSLDSPHAKRVLH